MANTKSLVANITSCGTGMLEVSEQGCKQNSTPIVLHYLVTTLFGKSIGALKVHTVDILIMHNVGPQLFVCMVTFYARQNVSQSVTIRDLCQKCHTSVIGQTSFHGFLNPGNL